MSFETGNLIINEIASKHNDDLIITVGQLTSCPVGGFNEPQKTSGALNFTKSFGRQQI